MQNTEPMLVTVEVNGKKYRLKLEIRKIGGYHVTCLEKSYLATEGYDVEEAIAMGIDAIEFFDKDV